jgi:hypothetical protein
MNKLEKRINILLDVIALLIIFMIGVILFTNLHK